MTIIEPNRNSYFFSGIAYFVIFIVIGVILNIYFYNLNVSLRHQMGLREKSMQELETLNADLRNQFYHILEAKNLTVIIQKQNLISDKNPDYLEREPLAAR